MNSFVKFSLFAAGAAGLAAGGYAAVGHFQCRGYEEDFLNAFSSVNSNAALAGLGQAEPGLTELAYRLRTMAQGKMDIALEKLIMKCGERAGDSAIRKAQESIDY